MQHNPEKYNTHMLQLVAEKLGPLKDDVVFLGGAVMPFLATEPNAKVTRFTKDVDLIFEPETKEELYEFEDELRDLCFKKTLNAAVCQWVIEDVRIDILPTDPEVIGFDNRWCAEAKSSSVRVNIGNGLNINIVAGHCFLGLKFCAFLRRGRGNYLKSYDINDILLVIGSRPQIEEEIKLLASPELKNFITEELNKMCATVDNYPENETQSFKGTQPHNHVTVEALSRIERII